jgi:hypothetical protein
MQVIAGCGRPTEVPVTVHTAEDEGWDEKKDEE